MGCPARGGAPLTQGCPAHIRDLIAAVLSASPSLPVLLWDEHNSSVIARRGERAERALAAAAAAAKGFATAAPRATRALPRNVAVDDAAALVILQSYIDVSEGGE
jgi:RNase H-fold protein (predicted Holliday junction resolvase)